MNGDFLSDHTAERWTERWAAGFWAGTGLADTFPRPVERVVSMRLPLAVIKLPAVTVARVGRWLRDRRLVDPLPPCGGEQMGCLLAHGGGGFMFVCGADPPDEQRLTVAHEAAHFMLDYLEPRRRVLAALGPGAAAVLDGRRPATPAERAAALLEHAAPGAARPPPVVLG